MDTFTQKLDIGLAGEYLAQHYLENVLKHKVETTPGFNRHSDLLVNGKPVEIKTDVYSAKSRQIVLEHQSLKTHTAPTILFILPSFYWITRKDAQFIVDTWPDVIKIGDDLRPGTPVKFNSTNFNQYFKCLKNS